MWNREAASTPIVSAHERNFTSVEAPKPKRDAKRDSFSVGKSIYIKGDLVGSEDLTIDGQVEGTIELKQHTLTIGAQSRVRAQVSAKCVVVLGHLTGNIDATDKVTIRDNGMVEGDITAPAVAIAEGAQFRGSIDMPRGAAEKTGGKPATDTAARSQSAPSSQRPPATEAVAPRSAAPARSLR